MPKYQGRELPAWALQIIEKQERDITGFKERIETLSREFNNKGEAVWFIDNGLGKKIPLARKSETITTTLRSGAKISFRISDRGSENTEVQVSMNGTFDQNLCMMPEVSNAFRIGTTRR